MTLDTTPEECREALAATLQGEDVFGGARVLSHKSHDLAVLLDEIEAKFGLRLIVLLLAAKELGPQTQQTEWRIDLCVDVAEYVPLNQTAEGSQKGAWAVAFTVVSALKLRGITVGEQTIYPEFNPDAEVRELLAQEKWNAELLVVRVPLRFTVSGLPRPA